MFLWIRRNTRPFDCHGAGRCCPRKATLSPIAWPPRFITVYNFTAPWNSKKQTLAPFEGGMQKQVELEQTEQTRHNASPHSVAFPFPFLHAQGCLPLLLLLLLLRSLGLALAIMAKWLTAEANSLCICLPCCSCALISCCSWLSRKRILHSPAFGNLYLEPASHYYLLKPEPYPRTLYHQTSPSW